METFKQTFTNRYKSLMSLIGLTTLPMLLITLYGDRIGNNTGDFIHGIQVGLFFGVQIMVLYIAEKYRRLLREPAVLKTFYIYGFPHPLRSGCSDWLGLVRRKDVLQP
jgi:hypothetical protein